MTTILDLHDELLALVFARAARLGLSRTAPKLRMYRRLAALASLCKQAARTVNSTACCMQLLPAKFMRENNTLTPKQLLVRYFRPASITACCDSTFKRVRVYAENDVGSLMHELASKYGLAPHGLVPYMNGVMVDRNTIVSQPLVIHITIRPNLTSGMIEYDVNMVVHADKI